MKKLFVLLISLFLILTLSACNDDEKPQDDPEKITADKFYGTWDSHSAKIDGSIFTIEELETMGDYSLSNFRIIIKEGGKAYAYAEGEGELIDWELTDTGIKIGIRDCALHDNLLSMTNNDVTVFLSKTSSSQTIQNPETPNDSHTHSSQGLEYTLVAGGYEVTGIGTCTDTDIIIPKEYNGKNVVSIGYWAFYNCYSIKSISIPDTVTRIGDSAFFYCENLTSITLPNNVNSIGVSAFRNCFNLESINIPNSVTYIGSSAFDHCNSLTSVVIPNSINSIESSTFAWCSNLVSITIPNSVTSIGRFAFCGCSNLTNIIIPNGVAAIRYSAFYACSNLTSIIIADGITSIDENAFDGCKNLNDVYYTGTEEKWAKIVINSTGNSYLSNATIHYNYVPEDN